MKRDAIQPHNSLVIISQLIVLGKIFYQTRRKQTSKYVTSKFGKLNASSEIEKNTIKKDSLNINVLFVYNKHMR